MATEWQKGGMRYAKLKQIIPAVVAPASPEVFFVGVKNRGGGFRLINPFTPLQREYVVTVTADELLVLSLKRPGVFRASINKVELRESLYEADLRWSGDRLWLGEMSYQPIAFHDEDAEELVRYVEARRHRSKAPNTNM